MRLCVRSCLQPDWICLLLQRDRDARRAWQLLKAVQTTGWGGSASKPKPAKGQLQNPEKVCKIHTKERERVDMCCYSIIIM